MRESFVYRRLVLGSAAAAMGVALLAGALWARQPAKPKMQRAPTEQGSALAEEVEALKIQVASLQSRAAVPPVVYAAPTPSATAEVAAPSPAPSHEEDTRTSEQKTADSINAAVDNLEARLVSETPDTNWGRAALPAITSTITDNSAGTKVLNSVCGATLCKVEVEHDDSLIQRELGTKLGGMEPFRAGVLYQYDTKRQRPRTTLYVIREGHEF